MQAVSQPGVAIDLEDFRRLGVRPQETRLNVIRMAAARSSKTLAEQHLRSRDDQVAAQLSRVATSAYRLMDPRLREDEMSRVRVGRILPLTLNWAGRTRFADSSTHVTLDSAFHQQPMSDQELVELLDLDGTVRFEDEVQGWVPNEQDSDPVFLRRQSTPLEGLRSPLAIVITACVAATMVLTLVGYQFVASRSDRTTATSDDDGSAALRSDWERDNSMQPLMLATTMPLDDTSWINPQSLLTPAISDLAMIPSLSNWDAVVEPKSEGTAPQREFTRPTKRQLQSATESLQQQFPELQRLPLPNQISTQIQLLKDLSEKTTPGSSEHWVSQVLITELEWLSESTASVAARVDELASAFGESKHALMAETFASACGRASLPETHKHLLANGMSLADKLLVDQRFGDSRRVVEALRNSADAIEHEQTNSNLSVLAEAIDQAERLSSTARRFDADGSDSMSTEQDTATSAAGDQGVLGRYHCFYLRQWDAGLVWLCEAADPRVAGAAKRELELGPTSSPADTLKSALLWLSLADRSSGRVANSTRLHGVEMLESLLPHTRGVQKLKLQRAIEQHTEKIPDYLRRSLVSS